MPLFGSGFEPQKKLKPNLKMSVQRMAMVVNKKSNSVARHKREIRDLLTAGKYDKANIKLEHCLREERTIEAYEIISLMCELLAERLSLICADKVCPEDLVPSVHTVIWAGPRLEAPELKVVAQQFGCKYGKDFVRRARANADGLVNEKIMTRLDARFLPSKEERVAQMTALCGEAGIEFDDSMVTGSTLTGVFDEDNRNTGAAIPELPTFASYGGAAPGAGGYPQAGGVGAYPRGAPGGGAPANAYGGGPGGGLASGFPAVPRGPPGSGGMGGGGGMGAMPYRTGDPRTGATTNWQMGGRGAPAGAMPPAAAAPAPMPSFPMPNAGDYGRAAFSTAMNAPSGVGGAPMPRGPPRGLNPAVNPSYNPPPPQTKPGVGGGGGGAPGGNIAPSRNPAPSAVPDFDELSARFARLRDA